MSDPQDTDRHESAGEGTETAAEDTPSTEELQEPSPEKDPGEEPKGDAGSEPDVDHEAIGIGVVGRPQVDPDAVGD